MRKLNLLMVVILMSGCSKSMFNMHSGNSDEQKQRFELDDNLCRKPASSQTMVSPGNTRAKDYQLCMAHQGWSNNSFTNRQDAYKNELESQAKKFFQQHPEYLTSKQKESQLYTEFQKALATPNNQALSLYQILLVAHAQIAAS